MKPLPAKNKKTPIPAHPIKTKRVYTPLEIGLPIGICVLTFICFWHTLTNQFLYWDDNQYILNNIYIRRFTWDNVRELVSHQYAANWQPLTMLSYSLNYYFSKYSSFGYFFTNVLLHLANTMLVFFVIKKLLRQFLVNAKQQSILLIAGIVSLWFGIHPMHVESVGWLFERKDVLYTFFYLLGLLFYLKYINGERTKGMFILNTTLTILSLWVMIGLSGPSFHFMVGSIHITIWPPVVLFILASMFAFAVLCELKIFKFRVELFYVFEFFFFSLLSKPMAVVFPLSILLIDFLLNRKFKKNVLIEKVPFLLLSLLMGLLTLHTQSEEHAIGSVFSLVDRFFIASYSFVEYILKLFYPLHLSGFYPYPMNPGESLPSYFYLMPLIILLLAVVPIYYAYRKNKTLFRVLVFGWGFYLVNIILVLQFLSVGNAIISDRYSYLSYIGLFFILAYFINEIVEKGSETIRYATIGIGIVYTCFFGYLCYERTFAWSNTETMLGDVINQYPEKVPQAYRFLGIYYAKNDRLNDAYNCYDVLINKMHEAGPMDYGNMGRVYMSMNKIKEAVKYFGISIKLDSTLIMSYLNLGQISADTGNYSAALMYYYKAKSIYPNDESLNFQISLAHVATKQYTEAVNDYNILVQMNPDEAKYYYNRGISEYTLGNKDAAIEDFKKTLSMPVTPQDMQFRMDANSAQNLSIIYKEKGDEKTASGYAEIAQKLGARKKN